MLIGWKNRTNIGHHLKMIRSIGSSKCQENLGLLKTRTWHSASRLPHTTALEGSASKCWKAPKSSRTTHLGTGLSRG